MKLELHGDLSNHSDYSNDQHDSNLSSNQNQNQNHFNITSQSQLNIITTTTTATTTNNNIHNNIGTSSVSLFYLSFL